MKHIVISGDRGVGKSTLIKHLTEKLNGPVSGFITKKIKNEDGIGNIYIFPAQIPEKDRVCTEENCVGSCIDGKMLSRNTQVFEKKGVEILDKIPKDARLIVMDELGFLEKDAVTFQKKVLECLDADTAVLAAIKTKDNEFLTAIREHKNVCVYEINEQNRDELAEKLGQIIAM